MKYHYTRLYKKIFSYSFIQKTRERERERERDYIVDSIFVCGGGRGRDGSQQRKM